MRVAVVGAGISGLAAAYELAVAGAEVVVYEKEDYLGGHARTVTVDGVDLDLGFMVFNRVCLSLMLTLLYLESTDFCSKSDSVIWVFVDLNLFGFRLQCGFL
ncbi:Protoporphyrinogen oxidase, mitochondrial [Apostasia shenzhenica]|uniref:Protoporphyrinogen oxidase, mitochondrial n=1 Tax=Apostasia shenzhenica TaxID=1088818 RepID=A0A2I0AYI9_9ASPA|nr:Protoporphyrinogen oxidase, mitochondrial [Apostasia shenzhenica]